MKPKKGHVNLGQIGELSKLAGWPFIRSLYRFGTYKGIWYEYLKKRSLT